MNLVIVEALDKALDAIRNLGMAIEEIHKRVQQLESEVRTMKEKS